MIALQVSFRRMKWDRLRAACLAALMAASSFMPASSFAGNADDTKFASAIYLAYMRSGNSAVDSSAEAGLAALKDVLDRRTSVGPAGVVGLTPENDELSFFPFIYWPIAEGQADLSAKALSNVQRYLDNGGVILFDTRDQVSAPRSSIAGSAGGRNAATLRRLVGSLNIPALAPMKEDHVLGKSFYLMRSFPGRYDSGTLWVEQQSASGRDGVSSVIIGGHDWAYAWAAGAGSISGFGGGSARQNELALRFGVNVMIYALTGNYKADQVHLPHILERLGQ